MSQSRNRRSSVAERQLSSSDRRNNAPPRDEETPLAGRGKESKPSETPFANLRQLAGLIRRPATPFRRASSRQPSSGRTQATPNDNDGGLRPAPSRRNAPPTPHTLRARQIRRAAGLTPGRDRRRSGRMQRDTPRDALRALSKILAPTTQLPDGSSSLAQSSPRRAEQDDDELPEDDEVPIGEDFDDEDADDDLPGTAPRFSLPIDEEADESADGIEPPVLSAGAMESDQETGEVDDEATARSIEMPRRAIDANAAQSAFARQSFGGARYSDRFADLRDIDMRFPSEAGGAEDGGSRLILDEDGNVFDVADQNFSNLEDATVTRDLRRDFEAAQGRVSDIGSDEGPVDMNNTTFEFRIPSKETQSEEINDQPADVPSSRSPSPEIEMAAAEQLELPSTDRTKAKRPAKVVKLSRHGIACPSLPSSVVRKMATRYARSGSGKPKISKDTLGAIMHATDLFFEQLSDDLAAYAKHAGRATIDENDMITIMKRQRQIDATKTAFSLSQRHLPQELVQEMRLPAPSKKGRKPRRKNLETVQEEDED